MSDFLGNLAARSLGRLETLQPRLPSRFEPPGSAVAPDRAVEAGGFEGAAVASLPSQAWASPRAPRDLSPRSEQDLVARASMPPPEGRDPRSTGPEPVETPAPRRRRRPLPVESAPEAAESAPEAAAPRLAPRADRPAPEPTPESPRAAPPAPRLAPPAALPLLEAPVAAAPAANRPASPPPQAANRPASLPEPPGALQPPAGHGERREPATLREPRPAAVRLEPKVILAPPVRAAVPPRTPAREPRPGETPAPAIQVTIGRLEVRATKAPAAAASAALPRQAAAVPLQEYLDRRSRGGQR